MVDINESERKKEKRIKRNKDNLRDLQDNIKHSNIQIMGIIYSYYDLYLDKEVKRNKHMIRMNNNSVIG